MDFLPNSIYKFVTVGVQHISIWTYAGGVLSFFSCEIENPKDQLNPKGGVLGEIQELNMPKDDEKDHEYLIGEQLDDIGSLQVSFYSLCFVHNTIVTGANDGFLYFWYDNQIKKRQTAHPKSPILCLNSLKNTS